MKRRMTFEEHDQHLPGKIKPARFVLSQILYLLAGTYKWLYGTPRHLGVLEKPPAWAYAPAPFKIANPGSSTGIWTIWAIQDLRSILLQYIEFNMAREHGYTFNLALTCKAFWGSNAQTPMTGTWRTRNMLESEFNTPVKVPLWAAFRTPRYLVDTATTREAHHSVQDAIKSTTQNLWLVLETIDFSPRWSNKHHGNKTHWKLMAIPVKTDLHQRFRYYTKYVPVRHCNHRFQAFDLRSWAIATGLNRGIPAYVHSRMEILQISNPYGYVFPDFDPERYGFARYRANPANAYWCGPPIIHHSESEWIENHESCKHGHCVHGIVTIMCCGPPYAHKSFI